MTAQLEREVRIPVAGTALTTAPAAPTTPVLVADPGPGWLTGVAGVARVLWRRAPFTSSVVSLMLLLAVATGSLWRTAATQPWFDAVAYGVPSMADGRWWTPITGAFFALNPWFYLPMAGSFALLVGYTECRIGTRKAVLVTVIGHLTALAVGVLLLVAARHSGWTWATTVSTKLDAGFSAGALAAIAVASAAMRSPWRLRVRAMLTLYVVVSFVLVGTLADLLHLVAVAVALPLGPKLVRRNGSRRAGRPSRREWRLLAVCALLLTMVSDLILWLAPTDSPLGSINDDGLTTLNMVINVVVVALVANGLRKGRRLAWWLAVVFAGASAAIGILLPVGAYFVAAMDDTSFDDGGVAMFIAGRVAWTVLFLVLVIGRRAFRAPSPRRLRRSLAHRTDRTSATEILRKSGGSNLSWMTTWPDNRYFVTGSGTSVVAYQVHAGVAIAIGDPVGPTEERASAITEFVQDSERFGLVPTVFSATAPTTAAAAANGLREVQVAEDTLIDLSTLEFRGKSWQDIRTAINRAGKEQIRFRLTRLADEPWSVIAQVRSISEQWVGDKGLPEMGFTLGSVDEAMDREVRVGLAEDETGSIHGIVSWLPVYTGDGIGGWTLDLMRRRDGAFRPVVEFLIAESLLAFKAEGAGFASLSGAPLARTEGTEVTGLPKVLDTLGAVMEPVYGFRSLHAFKSKFQPHYASMHMIYRDEADLPRIGIALAKAYLPDASIRDLVRVARTAH